MTQFSRFSLLSLASLAIVTSVVAAPAATKIDLGTGTAKDKEAMVFSKDKLSAKAGAKITLNFKNSGTSKGMTHNFVLVKPGTIDTVLAASIAAGPDKGWIAESADVIAKSKLIDAGESVKIEFTAPTEPGDYPYICTFPGHATMRGVLKVTK
jgi:azurin